MDKDKILSFYETAYYKDLEDSNTVVSRFPILITGAALIVNIYVLLLRMWGDGLNGYTLLAVGLIALAPFIGMMISFYMVFQTKGYLFMPTIQEINDDRLNLEKYEKELKEWNLGVEKEERIEELEDGELFLNSMLTNYAACSIHNRDVNTYRKKWFYKSLMWVWINMAVCTTMTVLIIAINVGM